MQGMIIIMTIMIFIPVIVAIYILFKRLHEEPKDNKSREILLQALCLEQLRKKNGEDTSESDSQESDTVTDQQKDNDCQQQCEAGCRQEVPQIDDDIKKAISIAKKTLYSEDDQMKKDEEEKASKKKAAADMVMNMMKNKGKNGASREELQEMINVLSDKKK